MIPFFKNIFLEVIHLNQDPKKESTLYLVVTPLKYLKRCNDQENLRKLY